MLNFPGANELIEIIVMNTLQSVKNIHILVRSLPVIISPEHQHLIEHTETYIKWPQFRRRQIQIYLLQWKSWISIRFSLTFIAKGPAPPLSTTAHTNWNTKKKNQHLAEDIFKCILVTIFCIFIQSSLKFARKCQINSESSLVQMITWHRTCDMLLSVAKLSKVIYAHTGPCH